MKAFRVRPADSPRVRQRPNLYSRAELDALLPALLTRYEATSDQETATRLGTLVAICMLLLDDQAELTAAQRADCQRELLLDAAALGVTAVH